MIESPHVHYIEVRSLRHSRTTVYEVVASSQELARRCAFGYEEGIDTPEGLDAVASDILAETRVLTGDARVATKSIFAAENGLVQP